MPRMVIGSVIVSNVIGSVVSVGLVRVSRSKRLMPPLPPLNVSNFFTTAGAATAIALLEAGAQVVVLDLPDALERADLPDAVVRVPGDVLDSDAVARAVAAAGDLRVAVTCAGIATPGRLLGKEGEGFVQALKILDGGRISIAALGLGTAIGAFDTAVAYSKEREQFGKPISQFQAMQFAIAEMSTRIAAAQALTFAAAEAMDRGEKVSRLASEAKLYTGEAAVFCSERGVQIHGGYGFIKDYPVEKFYRDVKLCTIGEGTSEIQRLVIARQLLKS